MAGKRKLEIEILDSHKGTGFRDSERAATSWGQKLGGFAKVAAIGLAGVGVAAGAMGISFIQAAEESAKVTKQTAAVIKSMGGVAGVTANQVADLSEKLAMKTGIDDELIQSGQNVLLTFAKVRNEVGAGNDIFTRATQTALDMSVALGSDLSAANIQLGKALNDPIKGITALTRVGVTFTEDQKKQIKTLVEHGKTLEAQKIILDELGREFAGSAEAQATASAKLAVVWGNLQETLGEKLLPLAEAFSAWMIAEGVPWIEDHLAPAIEEDLVPAIQDLVKWLGENLLPALQDVAKWIGDHVVPALEDLAEWFGENELAMKAIVVAAAAVVVGLVAVKVAALAAGAAGALMWAGLGAPLILIIAGVAAVVGAFVLAFELIRRGLNKMGVDFSDVWGAIQRGASQAWEIIRFGALVTFQAIRDKAQPVLNFLAAVARVIQAAWTGSFQGILNAARAVFDWIIRTAETVASKVRSATAGIKAAGGSSGGFLGGVVSGLSRVFDSGGIVPGSGPQPITAHGGELIMNASQQGRLWNFLQGGGSPGIGGRGGNTFIFNIDRPVVANEAEFRRMVTTAASDALAVDPLAITVRGRPL